MAQGGDARRCRRAGDAGRRLSSGRRGRARSGRGARVAAARARWRQRARRRRSSTAARAALTPERDRRGGAPRRRRRCRRPRHDRRHRGPYRSRQDLAGARADRRRYRSPEGREGARHLDRSRLRLLPAPDGATSSASSTCRATRRFVHTMLAGATGIDFVLLVVAADDGVMPQTREHLAIVDLLGIRRGIVALTKADLADARAARRRSRPRSRNALAGTALAGCRHHAGLDVTGEGIDALREHAVRRRARNRRQRARRPLPTRGRSLLHAAGAGTVVTGTVLSGAVACRRPASSSARRALRRACARSMRRTAPAERGAAGERCALNLAGDGISKDAIARGDVVLDPALHAPTDRIDATSARARRARRKPVGAMDAGAAASCRGRGRRADRAARRRADRAGQRARWSSSCWSGRSRRPRGDRFVLRDTIGAAHHRRRPLPRSACAGAQAPHARSAWRSSRRSRIDDPQRRSPRCSTRRPAIWISTAFARDRALAPPQIDAHGRRDWRRHPHRAAATLGLVAGRMAAAQARAARDARGLPRRQSRSRRASAWSGCACSSSRACRRRPSPPCCSALARAGEVALDGAWVRLPSHEVRLTPEDEALWTRIAPLLGGGERFRPPRVRDIAGAARRCRRPRCGAC